MIDFRRSCFRTRFSSSQASPSLDSGIPSACLGQSPGLARHLNHPSYLWRGSQEWETDLFSQPIWRGYVTSLTEGTGGWPQSSGFYHLLDSIARCSSALAWLTVQGSDCWNPKRHSKMRDFAWKPWSGWLCHLWLWACSPDANRDSTRGPGVSRLCPFWFWHASDDFRSRTARKTQIHFRRPLSDYYTRHLIREKGSWWTHWPCSQGKVWLSMSAPAASSRIAHFWRQMTEYRTVIRIPEGGKAPPHLW